MIKIKEGLYINPDRIKSVMVMKVCKGSEWYYKVMIDDIIVCNFTTVISAKYLATKEMERIVKLINDSKIEKLLTMQTIKR